MYHCCVFYAGIRQVVESGLNFYNKKIGVHLQSHEYVMNEVQLFHY